METQLWLGKRTAKIERDENGRLKDTLPPQLKLSVPILFSAMSYGSISYNAHESLARAAEELGIYYNTGEGGLHRDFYRYGKNTIVQVASGRFGVPTRNTSRRPPPSRSRWARAQSRASAGTCRAPRSRRTYPRRA